MNRLRLALILLLVTVAVPKIAHADTYSLTITSFKADYYLSKDANNVPLMKVNEVIEASFPDGNVNHGILRALPSSYKGQPIDLNIESVTVDGRASTRYSTSNSNGNKVLKIGNGSVYVHGPVTYRIVYSLKNPITFYDTHDELYWNVNGTQWTQPFGSVEAVVHLPADIAANLQDKQLCYTGVQGSKSQDCTVLSNPQQNETIVTTTAQNLSAGQNLSFVLGFNKGTFALDKAAQSQQRLDRIGKFAMLVIPTILVGGAMFVAWRKNGRDAKGRGTIVPEYVPPAGLNSLTSDFILSEKLNNKAVTALVIELAIRKYLSLSEIRTKGLLMTKTDYTLTVLKPLEGLTAEELAVMRLYTLSPGTAVGTQVSLSALARVAQTEFEALSKSLPQALADQGYFKANPTKAVSKFRIVGTLGLMLAATSFIWLKASGSSLGWLMGGIGLASVVIMIFARLLAARTDKGAAAKDYLSGLKMYMELAEADRIRYLQSPEGVRQWGSPDDPNTKLKLFEKLLPYAIIFGLEKDWAKQFEGIYKQPPSWYNGDIDNFSTGMLVGSINSFNSVSSTTFSPPSSSSSSGFGGGGFSGGGGGGGGGGGW